MVWHFVSNAPCHKVMIALLVMLSSKQLMQALIRWSYYPCAEMELEWLSLKSWEKWVGTNCTFQNRSQFDFKMIWILGLKPWQSGSMNDGPWVRVLMTRLLLGSRQPGSKDKPTTLWGLQAGWEPDCRWDLNDVEPSYWIGAVWFHCMTCNLRIGNQLLIKWQWSRVFWLDFWAA
jgi:hypothetical protein